MSNKLRRFQNLLALSAATLIITVWATVSFLMYQNKQLKNYTETNQFNNGLLKVTPTPPQTDTANWKTYKNIVLGFEFKYPDDIFSVKIDNELEFGKRNSINLIKNYPNSEGHPPPTLVGGVFCESKNYFEGRYGRYKIYPVTIWVLNNAEGLSEEQFYMKYGYYPFSWHGESYIRQKHITTPNTILLTSPKQSSFEQSHLIYNGDRVFTITISNQPQVKTHSNQILSTFEFVE